MSNTARKLRKLENRFARDHGLTPARFMHPYKIGTEILDRSISTAPHVVPGIGVSEVSNRKIRQQNERVKLIESFKPAPKPKRKRKPVVNKKIVADKLVTD